MSDQIDNNVEMDQTSDEDEKTSTQITSHHLMTSDRQYIHLVPSQSPTEIQYNNYEEMEYQRIDDRATLYSNQDVTFGQTESLPPDPSFSSGSNSNRTAHPINHLTHPGQSVIIIVIIISVVAPLPGEASEIEDIEP